MGGGSMDFSNLPEPTYDAEKNFLKGSSTGFNYGSKDFSWFDKALGRGEELPSFQDSKRKVRDLYRGGGSYRRKVGEEWETIEGQSAADKYNAWSGKAMGRIREANKMAYEKAMSGEITAEDYKKLMGQKGFQLWGDNKTLGSYDSNYGAQVAGLAKQQASFKKMRGGQASLEQLAPGIREQSGEVVKGLLKNQAKASLLGKV